MPVSEATVLACVQLKRGATVRLTVQVRARDGTPLDISGWQVGMQVRAAARLVHSFVCTIDDGPQGRWSAHASSAQTTTWPTGPLESDVCYQDAAGNVLYTRTFTWRVHAAVTDPPTGAP